ncbi:hypothetical protein TUM4261_32100 [Shewanella sp. c952]|uniref:competence protein CoiA family protein n=1 Tax=Shewanella sp. c952 TaxID=2815913 RepID=UPI001BBE7691|nr:competence protein CoiA family protein [Shewanella sp. c952]GIU15329.1 hypothetical protein TUM4261_32100 [Shewanella sp. c952]
MSQFQAVKMTYALNNEGNFVSVEDVENGLGCECVCIDCHGRLSAKQGKVKQWHFAHHQESDKKNCQWSGESEIHLRVKKYLDRHRKLTVPIGFSNPTSLTINFDDVKLEKSLRPTKRIPDVTGYCDGERILIEVKVTHEVDRLKASEYKAANASVIEIDFSDFTLFEDVISDKHIESHLKRTCLLWISVAPAGAIAQLFQGHERAITKKLIDKNKQLQREQDQLDREIKHRTEYVDSFEHLYSDYKKRVKAVTDELVEVSTQVDKFRSEQQANIEAARSSFSSTMDQLEDQHLRQLDEQNEAKFDRLEQDFIQDLYEKHKSLLSKIHEAEYKLDSKLETLASVEEQLGDLDEKSAELLQLESKLHSKAVSLKERDQAWLLASSANASIRRHFSRIEPDLRLICKKGGIPWPFKDCLLDELSQILDTPTSR